MFFHAFSFYACFFLGPEVGTPTHPPTHVVVVGPERGHPPTRFSLFLAVGEIFGIVV